MEDTQNVQQPQQTAPAQPEMAGKKKKTEEFSVAWHLKALAVIYVILAVFYVILKITLK
jgi:hypothetical protein